MKYISYILKQAGREGVQPLALFARWPFQNGIQFGNRLLAAIDTQDDLTQLLTDGKEFDMREQSDLDYLLIEKSNFESQSARLRNEADLIDMRLVDIGSRIATISLLAKPIVQ